MKKIIIYIKQWGWARVFTLIILTKMSSCQMEADSAYIYDVYTNGKIYSLDSQGRIYSTMVVKDGRIWAIGMEEILDTLSEEDRIFDLDYKYVFPGLIEGQGYVISLGGGWSGRGAVGYRSGDVGLERVSEVL